MLIDEIEVIEVVLIDVEEIEVIEVMCIYYTNVVLLLERFVQQNEDDELDLLQIEKIEIMENTEQQKYIYNLK